MLSTYVFEVTGFVLLIFYFLLGLSPAWNTAYCFNIKKNGSHLFHKLEEFTATWGQLKECGF